jgi:hypothetical protein
LHDFVLWCGFRPTTPAKGPQLQSEQTVRPPSTVGRRAAFAVLLAIGTATAAELPGYLPGRRVLLDAHNAYPEQGMWSDRIDRALATGVPLAIEQDLVWFCEPPAPCRSVLRHNPPFTGQEPTLRAYFFERIRPIVERALADGDRHDWPLITLNLDFKSDEPEHHAAVWALLGEYEAWLTTAARTASVDDVAALEVRPVLVFAGAADAQQISFHDSVPAGGRLRLFGAAVSEIIGGDSDGARAAPAGDVFPGRRTNYRRWSNHPWSVVEAGGPSEAGDWTREDTARLSAIVRRAHDAGLWIRFYTLNGLGPAELSGGWAPSYNFGSLEAVELRWRAAIEAGVDFIATDQYETFAAARTAILTR